MCTRTTLRLRESIACLCLVLGSTASAAAEVPGALLPSSLEAAEKVLLTRDEALKLAFGSEAEIERSTVCLDEKEQAKIAALAKVDFSSSVVYPYRATKKGVVLGTAYFDTHNVRTLRETLMVVVKADGTLGRVEVLSFAEPKNYLPRSIWYEQFRGRKLDQELNLERKIRGVAGATLSAQATVRCARRVLALHAHLEAVAEAKRKEEERKRREREKEKGTPPPRPDDPKSIEAPRETKLSRRSAALGATLS